eukprot:XP_014031906.1 PREDICTED: glutamic acid-rich protein-like [Salmo salar]
MFSLTLLVCVLRFTPGAAVQQPEKKKMGPSPADVEAIKNAIANASSLAEVERLKGMLQAGQIPGREVRQVPPEMVEVEEEEEENGVVHMEREIQTEEGNGVEEMEEDVVEVQGKVEEVQRKVEEVDVKEVEEVEKEEVEEEEEREEGKEQESEEDESEDDDMDEDSPVNGS